MNLFRALDCALTAFVNELSPYDFPILRSPDDDYAGFICCGNSRVCKDDYGVTECAEGCEEHGSFTDFRYGCFPEESSPVERPGSSTPGEVSPEAGSEASASGHPKPLTASEIYIAAGAVMSAANQLEDSNTKVDLTKIVDRLVTVANSMK